MMPRFLAIAALAVAAGLPLRAGRPPAVAQSLSARTPAACDIAIVGATLLDGNGGPAVRNAVVLVSGKRITAVGQRASMKVPTCGRTINAMGKFLTPGFIDTNVHISLAFGLETLARYFDRLEDITLEGAQLQLKYGVTTVRDSYGFLRPLVAVRDRINRGEAVGSRMFVAGNIVGWGGNVSYTFSKTIPTTLLDEQMDDAITQGAGEELIQMTPDEIRVEMDKYLNKGVDFVKFGGTMHGSYPSMLIFSERQAKAIVDETHRHGKPAETHAMSPEGLYVAIMAGIDLVQHPEWHDVPLSDEVVKLLVERKVICSMNISQHAGKSWQDLGLRLQKQVQARKDSVAKAEAGPRSTNRNWKPREKTRFEIFKDSIQPLLWSVYRENAKRLIKAGCIISTATDNDMGAGPEFIRDPNSWRLREPGIGTLFSIEGLVELGMTPSQAIVAATKHGAMASRGLKDFGTVETGKYADLVLLNADPLLDIHNVRKIGMVMKEGAVIDIDRLPEKPVFYTKPALRQ